MTSGKVERRPQDPRFQVQVLNRQRRFKISPRAVESLCSGILELLNQPACSLAVIFVGPGKMQALNRRYRGRDGPTDVLTFLYEGELVDGEPFLGEVVVSPEVASKNAQLWNVPLRLEIQKLLVHGVLHLLGYDHEADDGEMKRLERRILRSSVCPESLSVAR